MTVSNQSQSLSRWLNCITPNNNLHGIDTNLHFRTVRKLARYSDPHPPDLGLGTIRATTTLIRSLDNLFLEIGTPDTHVATQKLQ